LVRALLACAALLSISAATSAAAVDGDPMRGASASVDADFARWLAGFRARAAGEGISEATLAATLDGLSYNPRVVDLDRGQPDDSRPASVPRFADYLAGRLTPGRIAPGRRLASDLAATLAAVEARFGVPDEIVLAIWGMETGYGAVTGNFDVVRALASLAFDGRREELFARELVAALRMLDTGAVRRDRLVGSWAGALGNPQFLPTSYLAHAVDFDGDARADIWSSPADTAASIANYLARAGWRQGGDWAMRVAVPAELDRARIRDLVEPKACRRVLGKHSRWLSVAEWRALGLAPLDGRRWPADDALATLVEPDGEGQGGYLTYGNYRALLDYNCSNFYALSVGLLADAIAAAAAADGGVRIDP
jgi:lytic murein transglycosylase